MRSVIGPLVAVAILFLAVDASASDACSGRAVVTSARVHASDGKRYVMETYFSAPEIAAIRQVNTTETTVVAAEGPRAWTINQDDNVDDNILRSLALGHQFHALLMYFDEIVVEAHDGEAAFHGRQRAARIGGWPYGEGEARLISNRAGVSEALILAFPGRAEIVVTFADWRRVRGQRLPFRATIDDGQRTFNYTFTSVSTADRAANWFFDALPAPASEDAVQIYRSHRRSLAAHCVGDAHALAAEGGPIEIDVGGDGVRTQTQAGVETRFTDVLNRLDYSEYHDDAWPVIEVSDDGTLGWAAVTVRAVGHEIASGERFEDRWSWVALMRKIDGAWRRVGVSAVRRED